MPHRFDASNKFLSKLDPRAWAKLLKIRGAKAVVMDSDFSTVTASGDAAIFLLSGKTVHHLEFQSAYYGHLDRRTLFHNRLFNRQSNYTVRSVIILLHPKANSPKFTGHYREEDEDGVIIDFYYAIIRVWLIPAEEFLQADLALLPYATIAKTTKKQMPEIIERMRVRFEKEASPQTQAELWVATRVLMGLKYTDQEITHYLRGVLTNMRESVVYQKILREGSILKAQNTILRLGGKRFGEPSEATQEHIRSIQSEAELDALIDRLLAVETWEEFLPEQKS